MKKLFLNLIFLIVSLGIYSCEAPHTNPLDPTNPDYFYGLIDGFVLTQARAPISGAKIIWKNQNTIAFSDTTGYYKIDEALRNDGWILFDKDGFGKDSIFVRWNNQRSRRLEEKLLNYTIGYIDGFVFTQQRVAISGVSVIWKNENKISTTNSTGYFRIDNLKMNNGMLYYEKHGLKKDSQYVQWGTQNSFRAPEKTLDYNIGQIVGTVKTVSLPRKGIKDVNVFWKNQNLMVKTDNDGNFILVNINYQNGWLRFEKDGFKTDSLLVQFGNQSTTSVGEFYLNSIPKLNSANISSIVIHRYTETRFRISVQASITDSEGDVNFVQIKCDQLSYTQRLMFNPSSGFYEANYDFGQKNISDGLGKDFTITARDNNNDTYTIGTVRLTRVIDKEINPMEPINSANISSPPTFVWERFIPGFSFTYKIEVYTATIPSELYWSQENISSDEIRFTPTITFPNGDYYWIIWCVDEFNNQSRSKEASFIVK